MVIAVKAASEKPVSNTYTYTLAPGTSSGKVGSSITVNVGLTSSTDNYKLYAGEYRITIPETYLTLGTVTTSGAWSYGTKSAGGLTTLTFANLDETN